VVNGAAIALLFVSMSKWLKIGFFALLIVSIALMAGFPKAPGQGSFQSVNGPTTVFDAWRAALLVAAILLSAANAVTAPFHSLAEGPAGTHDPKERSCTMLC
jgi:hypothetical protein